ncbi:MULTISPECIES: 3-oxoadipate enol-lactonase [unclassified Roseitalea]|uniref:3-oxoadipate enol-lactonase n=1 Tax=unclassified Roseitalea TaxID=2639107 RepID=UPI00273E15B1|nr:MULTISPECIES: 3-oxoadipate enol-lactonase [unclassified Roseitalea]
MQFANINGVTLHFQVIGAAEGKPTIVFANALGTDFRIWRDVIVRLVGDFALVMYDKRGHGLSDVGEAPYAMDDHVGDLAGLLDHLSVSQAIVCGLSVGGLIALGLAGSRPELVRALVLCDTAPRIGSEAVWNERIETVQTGGIAALAEPVLERWFTPEFRHPANAELAGYRNMLVRQPPAGYAGTCAAIRDADFTDIARALTVPAACVVGDQDGSTPPEVVGEMAKLIPDARYDVLTDCGHIPCVERPEALANIVRAFAREVAGPPPGT